MIAILKVALPVTRVLLVTKVDHSPEWAVRSAVPKVWVTKAKAPADHKVVLSPETWAEVLDKVWTVATLVVAAALVLVTQDKAAANVAKAACSL